MMDQRDRMIDIQAKKISMLNEQVKSLHEQVHTMKKKLEIRDHHSDQYKQLIAQIEESDILRGEWMRFCSFLKMTASEKYLKDVGEEA
jgi:uncharacterized protein (DUF3084 family)